MNIIDNIIMGSKPNATFIRRSLKTLLNDMSDKAIKNKNLRYGINGWAEENPMSGQQFTQKFTPLINAVKQRSGNPLDIVTEAIRSNSINGTKLSSAERRQLAIHQDALSNLIKGEQPKVAYAGMDFWDSKETPSTEKLMEMLRKSKKDFTNYAQQVTGKAPLFPDSSMYGRNRFYTLEPERLNRGIGITLNKLGPDEQPSLFPEMDNNRQLLLNEADKLKFIIKRWANNPTALAYKAEDASHRITNRDLYNMKKELNPLQNAFANKQLGLEEPPISNMEMYNNNWGGGFSEHLAEKMNSFNKEKALKISSEFNKTFGDIPGLDKDIERIISSGKLKNTKDLIVFVDKIKELDPMQRQTITSMMAEWEGDLPSLIAMGKIL